MYQSFEVEESDQLPEIDTGLLTTKPKTPTYSKPVHHLSKSEKPCISNETHDRTGTDRLVQLKPDVSREGENQVEEPDENMLTLETVKNWKVTGDNFEESFAILETAIKRMLSADPKDLVNNPHSFEQESRVLNKCMMRSYTPKEAVRLEILKRMLNLNLSDLYKNWYMAITDAHDKIRPSYPKDMTNDDIWNMIKVDHTNLYKSMNLYASVLTIIWNGSDIKDPQTSPLLYDATASFLLNGLDSDYLFPPQKNMRAATYKVVKAYLGTMHNFSNNLIESASDLRKMGALRILGKYRQLTGDEFLVIKTKAILSTAALITEDPKQFELNLTDTDVKFILKLVKGALASKDHHSSKSGYRADELMQGVNHISAIEANKIKLIEAGILPIYVKALKTGNKSLQVLAATGIWSLAFDGKSKESIKNEPGCIDLLKDLAKSEDQEIKDAASGAMWQIEGESKHKEHIDKQVQPGFTDVAKHIMISYQWDVKPEVLMVRERLREAGFRVWIDVEQMGGSTLESMAFAVENAAVVVPVLTEKYKLSPACRQEAEYANFLQKKMVPLRLQPKYRPDGWLGFMLGSTFFYDLTKPATYEEKLVDFINAIGDAGKIKPGEALEPAKFDNIKIKPDAAPVSSGIISAPLGSSVNPDKSVVSAPGSQQIDVTKLSCYKWTPEEVRKWLANNSLDAQKEKFDGYDGALLCELLALQLSCPEVYYSFLREEYKMPLKSVLTLNKAMRTITQT